MSSTYSVFKDEPSSEKLTLAILYAAKRLIAFSVHSGSVYKIESFDVAVIHEVKDSGVALTEVTSVASVVAGTFYNDRENKVLYLRTSDSASPNTKFIHMVMKLFYASGPVSAPHDLDDGFNVYWEPTLDSTSSFGVEIDTVNQQNEAIEGSGTLTLLNDQVWWPANFDKLIFDNQLCYIYSWSRHLPITEAKLLFKGKVESKSWSSNKIQFKMKDLLSIFKNALQLDNIEDLSLRNNPALDTAKQRLIFGRVFGHRPVNCDEVLNYRYPLTGTVSTTTSSTTVTGSGTSFLTELSPDDRLDLGGTEFTIASIASDTSLTITEAFTAAGLTSVSVDFLPQLPKRFINRVWNLAGHTLREPTTTIQVGSSVSYLFLDSTQDMYPGDRLYVGTLGSGELVVIDDVLNSTTVRLSTSLTTVPATGTLVTRPCVQSVMIDDVALTYYQDYTVNATTAMLTLRDTAETNSAPIRESVDQGVFTNASRTVTGSGTFFKSFLKPGYNIRPKGTVDFYEVLSVDSDVSLTLKTAVSGMSPNPKTAEIQYQSLVFDPASNVLHCEVLGRTDDGTSGGTLLKKAPEIVRALLTDVGVADADVNETSFTTTQSLLPEDISLVIPAKYNDKKTQTYREVFNGINKSVFGVLYQDNDFKISYDLLRPVVPTSPLVLRESDCLSISVVSTNKNMVKTVRVSYLNKEHDGSIGESSEQFVASTSDISTYILNTEKEKVVASLFTNEADARRLANRWKFLLEYSSNSIRIETKLQASELEINDILDISHRKLFDRFGGTSRRKIVAVERIVKSGTGCEIECVDLSNAFNRVGLISANDVPAYSDANESTRIISGFITDANGLIDNEENSYYSNLIW
jgi:hypothetical protein